MTTLVMLGILIFGVAAFRLLPVSDLPNVDFPTIQVSASLPGGSPETMAASVATPLERQFSTIAGIDSMSSTSSQGRTQITLQFNLSRNIDASRSGCAGGHRAGSEAIAGRSTEPADLPESQSCRPAYSLYCTYESNLAAFNT